MSESATEPRLLGLDEAFERLGIGRSKGYQLVSSGELRTVTIGRRRLVSESAIREFITKLARD
ncbi:helix-turn-helix domain-containing protein [Mycobacterium sp. OTB74]|jgi:excisionase family DNA binding protein|uniref:helix-turn-helix domain-containing protein n=1 Tax=Mycobacterium sp. OTB74 TaxID=1853452 RepID=UPI002473DC1A|nr:helix-turn-helix domain-containing protein [Mycobacterium sp. OTB74]MDH6247550.1 excisionase family DNA binding protein [Mycobacterium sp. OTB74]